MNKENRKRAQQRRAEARKKAEQKRKIKKFLSYFLPITAVVILAAVIIVDYVKNPAPKETETQTEQAADTDTNTDTESKTPTLSTDTALTVADGDKVNIDYVGSIDGVEFEGGNTQGKGTDLTIGSGLYIDDFEEQLIGAHPGDQVDVYATFPEDYGQEDLNGKEALFKVTINGIYR